MSNTDSIETSAATIEDAVAHALAELGASKDEVEVEILTAPRSGLLGLGAREAHVRVTRRPRGAKASGVTAPPQQRREGGPRRAGPRRSGNKEAAPPRQPPPRSEAGEAATREGGIEDGGDADRRMANADEQVSEASAILAQLLELMNEKSEIRRGEGDRESIELEIKGDGSGILIGRHGQTLDALEYIINRVVARRIKEALPIVLDTESYRARRRQQLHRMALSMGERVKRDHQPVKLDPMPPRDRRIVHLALKDDPMLNTRSTGDGFLRAVEIVPVEERRERRGEREDKRDREREQERPRERPREPEQSSIGEQGGFKHGQKRLF